MLGQPRWHLAPGELLTVYVLPAEEALPACLEMSDWWVAGPAQHPTLTNDAGHRLQSVMEPGWEPGLS